MKKYTIKTSLREVDCTNYAPIIKHPHVIRLGDVTQLSFVDKVYRGGRHSRLDHSVFVFHFMDEITNHLLKKGCINKEEKTNLEIAAILHDIGHPSYSHATEFIAQALEGRSTSRVINHKIRAAELIESELKDRNGRTLKECIEICGGDPELVKNIILNKIPLSEILSHNTLGADKIGYTLLDSNRTFFYPVMPFFLDIFPEYYFDGEKLGLESCEKLPQIKSIQLAYQDMYLHVYFHPDVRFYERVWEKCVETLIKNRVISVEELWNLEEYEIKTIAKNHEESRKLFMKIQMEEFPRNSDAKNTRSRVTFQSYQEERFQMMFMFSNTVNRYLKCILNITKVYLRRKSNIQQLMSMQTLKLAYQKKNAGKF